MDNIKNKNVIITGAAGGLGYEYAEDLLQHGASFVAILDLSTSSGEKSAQTLEKQFGKGKAKFFPCDVTKDDDVKEAFRKTVDHCKRLDIVINNAGILNEKKWEQTIDCNVHGLIRCAFMALDYMGKHKGGTGGTLVNIASIVGLCGLTGAPVYSASKHAVIGFSRSLQESYQKTGIRVLVMCPGVTHTNLIADLEKAIVPFVDTQKALDELAQLPQQTVDNVSRAMMDLIQKGKNGAIWVSEGGEPPYAVEIPHYSKIAVPIKKLSSSY